MTRVRGTENSDAGVLMAMDPWGARGVSPNAMGMHRAEGAPGSEASGKPKS